MLISSENSAGREQTHHLFGPHLKQLKWIFILALNAVIFFFVLALVNVVQFSAFALFLVPAAVAGFLLGTLQGVVAGFISAAISIYLAHFLGEQFPNSIGLVLPWALSCIAMSFVFGKLNLLNARWKDEATQRKLVESALWDSKERYRVLFEHGADSVLIIDPSPLEAAVIVEANETACRTHGYSRDEIIGLPLIEVIADITPRILASRLRRILDGELLFVEAAHIRRDGTVFPVEVTACRIDVGEKPLVQAIDRDITLRKKAEEERERLSAQFQQAQKMEAIGRLAGGVAHDINNILGAIMGAASSTSGECEQDSRFADVFDDILAACRQGRDLTRNLLGFAREGRYVRERLSLGDLIDETVSLLNRTAPKGINIVTSIDREALTVEADRSQIGQVLMNIYVNAVDAMGESGTLSVTATKVMRDQDEGFGEDPLPRGAYVEVHIADTGGGFDDETLNRAFEPFYTTKPQGKGTGLGLAMVYGAIKNHNGAVKISNEPGKGALVSILLPVVESIAQDEAKTVSSVPPPSPGEGPVLLVDDEALVRRSAERLLDKLGYSLFIASNGADAVDIYKREQKRITLVILDLAMPNMDGEETFNQLKEIDQNVNVLISSGYIQNEKVENLLAKGARGFIQKPFDLKELAAKLKQTRRV